MQATGEVSSLGTWGFGGAAATTFKIDPQEGLVVLHMTQVMQRTQPWHEQLLVRVYAAIVTEAGHASRL